MMQLLADRSICRFLMASALMGLANGSFDAVYNFRLGRLGLSKADIGQVYFWSMVIMAIAVLAQGIAARRFGVGRVYLFASALYTVPFVFILFAESLILNGFILGLISGGFVGLLSTGAAIFGNQVEEERRVNLFSGFFVFYLGSTMIGSFGAAWFVSLDLWAPAKSYDNILITSALFAVLMSALRYFSVRDIAVPTISTNTLAGSTPVCIRSLAFLGASSFMLGASIIFVFRFSNLVFIDTYKMTVEQSAIVLGTEKLFALIGALVAPTIRGRFDQRLAIVGLTISTVIALSFQATLPSIALFLVGYFVRIGLNYAVMPILDALSVSGFPKDRSIVSTTTRQLSFYAGGALSALAYGALLQAGLPNEAFVFAAITAGVGGMFMLLIPQAPKLTTAVDSSARA